MTETNANLDLLRAQWATRIGQTRSRDTIKASEQWGLNMLAEGSDGPLSQAAAIATGLAHVR